MNSVSSITIIHQNVVTVSVGNFNQIDIFFLTWSGQQQTVFPLVKCCDKYLFSFSPGIKARVMLIASEISFTADKFPKHIL